MSNVLVTPAVNVIPVVGETVEDAVGVPKPITIVPPLLDTLAIPTLPAPKSPVKFASRMPVAALG
jgi:hypothetical protein